MSSSNFIDDSMCFVCGQNNPIGMKKRFIANGDKLSMVFNLDENYQGWQNVIHGGIVSTILDEVQVQVAAFKGYKTATADINVRFKLPVNVGRNYTCNAWIVSQTSKVIYTEAHIVDEHGIVYATSNARLFVLGQWTGYLKLENN